MDRGEKRGRGRGKEGWKEKGRGEKGRKESRNKEGEGSSVDKDAVYRNILAADGFDEFVRKRYSDEQRLSVCYEDLIAESSSWESIRSFLRFEGDILPQKAFAKRQGLGAVSRVANHNEIIEYLASKGISD